MDPSTRRARPRPPRARRRQGRRAELARGGHTGDRDRHVGAITPTASATAPTNRSSRWRACGLHPPTLTARPRAEQPTDERAVGQQRALAMVPRRASGRRPPRRPAADGARVAMLDIDELPSYLPADAIGSRADVADEVAVQAAVTQVVEAWGGLDIVAERGGATRRRRPRRPALARGVAADR